MSTKALTVPTGLTPRRRKRNRRSYLARLQRKRLLRKVAARYREHV